MRAMTAAGLRSACGGESMAHMRCEVWGGRAEKDGLPSVAGTGRQETWTGGAISAGRGGGAPMFPQLHEGRQINVA